MTSADVIVVGLGAMGSATLDQLAGRGVDVLGIEAYGIPHGLGSSGGDSRLIRKAYFEHPDYVPLLERAYAGWRALQSETGELLLQPTGILYLGSPDGDLVSGSLRSAAAHGLALEVLDDAALAREYPLFRRPPGYLALLEPDAGFLLAERGVRAQVERALRRGARLVGGERVLRWEAGPGGISVFTDGGRYMADRLVLTAGSWSAGLLAELGLSLEVTRQPLFWVQPRQPERFALGRFPCWAVERPDRPGLYYGFPALPAAMAAQLGVKLAHHAPGEPADPDAPRLPVEPEELRRLLEAVAPFVPALAGPMTGSRVCLYTLSADGHFLVDRHPEHANVAFGCGFSGHGFKFAPVVGEVLADLALHGATSLPVDFLRLR